MAGLSLVGMAVAVIFLVGGLLGGYAVGVSGMAQKTTTSTEVYTSVSTVVTVVTTTTTVTSTDTATILQSLTPAEGKAEGAQFVDVSCLTVCSPTSDSGSTSYFFSTPNATSVYSQIDANESVPGVGAAVSINNGQIKVTLTNSNTFNVCFEYLVILTQAPPLVYVWSNGQAACP